MGSTYVLGFLRALHMCFACVVHPQLLKFTTGAWAALQPGAACTAFRQQNVVCCMGCASP
jgi:hypothetical protein